MSSLARIQERHEPASTVGPRRYLQPGELLVSREPVELVTILGSCVAVCAWAPAGRAGGMNHFLLPESPAGRSEPLRFGDTAVQRLVEELGVLGFPPACLEAKVFGGAAVLGAAGAGHLGERNVSVAVRRLEELGVRVVARDTGGERGRKLRFFTADGDVLVRRLGGAA